MIPSVSRRALAIAAVIALLAIMEASMVLSVRQESQTSDEAYSLLAGYLHLTTRDFSLCPGYPPLTKDVGALPLLVARPRVPPMTDAEASDFRGGRIFLYANRADQLLFAARAAMTIFPLLLAVIVFLATREMFGAGPAFMALTLMVFEPNILAHGPLVTNDVTLACMLFATVYGFWRYVVKPSAWRLAVCGFAAGLTLAAKHSGVILFPVLFLLALVDWLLPLETSGPGQSAEIPERNRRRGPVRLIAALTFVAAISMAVVWAFYGFRYSASPAVGPSSSALAVSLGAMRPGITRSVLGITARAHLLPEAFLEGFTFFSATASRPTYLLGRLHSHGVWFYFPVAIVIKSSLGFLGLLFLAPFARLWNQTEERRRVLWMLIPAASFLAISMTSKLNIGIRHILPIYPFLAVFAAAGAWKLAASSRFWRILVASFLVIHVASSLRAFPNYLAYSNELWGGPSKTYQVLTDSNVDWGQGLPAAKRYLQAHAGTPCWLAYFGTVDPGYYDLPCTLLPVTSAVIWERPLAEIPPVIQGTVLVSATEMSGQAWGPGELNPYEQFRTAPPAASLAGSIMVYQGSFQVPLATALSRLWTVVALANRGEFDAAVAKARTAESLAPQSVDVQFVLGRALRAAGHRDESRQAFEKALRFARTIHPEYQAYWIPAIEAELTKP